MFFFQIIGWSENNEHKCKYEFKAKIWRNSEGKELESVCDLPFHSPRQTLLRCHSVVEIY